MAPQQALWTCPQWSLQTQDKISTDRMRIALNISRSSSLSPEDCMLVVTAGAETTNIPVAETTKYTVMRFFVSTLQSEMYE